MKGAMIAVQVVIIVVVLLTYGISLHEEESKQSITAV